MLSLAVFGLVVWVLSFFDVFDLEARSIEAQNILQGFAVAMGTANKDCAPYVTDRKEFKGSNLFGEWDYVSDWEKKRRSNTPYVVYSYGRHFPIYIWLDGVWYENTDKYSVSTSKHQTQARPDADTVQVDTQGMKDLISRNVMDRLLAIAES